MDNYYYDHMFGWGAGGALMMVFFWIFIIFLVVWLIKEVKGGHFNEHRSKSALDILKERYAKGEIDKKEFDEKKKDL